MFVDLGVQKRASHLPLRCFVSAADRHATSKDRLKTGIFAVFEVLQLPYLIYSPVHVCRDVEISRE